MTSSNIIIDHLANHPEIADELARISWNEWRSIYEQRGETFSHALSNYRERTNVNRLPLALIAFIGDEFVGTVSLKHQDLDIRPKITPWLGGLFVIPRRRRRGVASLLMRRALEEAARLTLPSLFLWTSSAEALYLRLGWRTIERADYCDKSIAIMRIDTVD